MHKKGRPKISTESYLSHSVKENRSGSLLCFRNILVPKKNWIRVGDLGSITTLRLNFFLFVSEYRYLSLGKTSVFQKVSGIESVRDKRGGGYHNFPSRIFCSTVVENTWGKLLLFRKILVSKKVKDKRKGGYHTFPPKICCLTVPKNHVEELSCCRKFLVSKNIMDKRGGMEGVS